MTQRDVEKEAKFVCVSHDKGPRAVLVPRIGASYVLNDKYWAAQNFA